MFGLTEELKSFDYKGFTYDYSDVGDDDCSKLCSEVVCGKKRLHFDWSPYSHPPVEVLKTWIDLGCPERISSGPLTERDLVYIRGAKYKTYTFDLQSRDSEWNRQAVRVTAVDETALRAIVANTWKTCDILNLNECTLAAQAAELAQFESSLG